MYGSLSHRHSRLLRKLIPWAAPVTFPVCMHPFPFLPPFSKRSCTGLAWHPQSQHSNSCSALYYLPWAGAG